MEDTPLFRGPCTEGEADKNNFHKFTSFSEKSDPTSGKLDLHHNGGNSVYSVQSMVKWDSWG